MNMVICMYDMLLQDLEYQEIMQKIDSTHQDDGWDWEHGIGHAKRVSFYVENFLSSLLDDVTFIEYGKVVALLHDIGLSTSLSRDTHAQRSMEMSEPFLHKLKIPLKNQKIMKQAILDHSNGENFSSLLGVALYLADKLDVTYLRVQNSIVKNERNQSVSKIKQVNFCLSENSLYIYYLVEEGFRPIIFKEWKKCLQAPYKVASYLHYSIHFFINDKEIEFPYENKQ